MNKRYAIVRVDNTWCPNKFENINNDFVCTNDYSSPFQKWHCKDCRYGDTKEQLIKKVAQVMLRRFKRIYKGKFITVEMAEKQYLETAKEIVEFLGVE